MTIANSASPDPDHKLEEMGWALDGQALRGDNLSPRAIEQWFSDEKACFHDPYYRGAGAGAEQQAASDQHEQGLTLTVFRKVIAGTGLQVVKETRCMFSLTSRLQSLMRLRIWTVGVGGDAGRLAVPHVCMVGLLPRWQNLGQAMPHRGVQCPGEGTALNSL